jgi:chemotaxis protein CheD
MKSRVNIHIGELHASKVPIVIATLLGSCVAVCLRDPVTCIGGMNHIMLTGKADMDHFNTMARYAINAMELLINRIMALGGGRRGLIAKVFGGANILPAISAGNRAGARNASFVLGFLKTESIPVITQDLGGHDTRMIYFHTATGDVLLKRISSSHHPGITSEEKRILHRVRRKAAKPGDIEFFV